MLSQLRNLTKGWVAAVIIGLVAIAFAIWGMPNMFSSTGRPAARVAGEAVSPSAVRRAFENAVRGAQSENPTLTRDQAVQQGVPAQVLDSLIFQEAVFGYAERLGLSASDAQVAQTIRGYPGFQDAYDLAGGGFDPAAYRRTISEAGYSVSEFESLQRRLIGATQLIDGLSVGARAPESFAAFQLAFESERRLVSVAELPPERVGRIADPDEAALLAFYQERASAWQEPERRTFAVVFADPVQFRDRAQAPDDRVEDELQRVASALGEPERRSFVQLVAADEPSARLAAERLSAGADAEALAAELNAQLIQHQAVAPGETPDRAVSEAAFSLASGGAALAVQGSLGPWSAVRLIEVTPAQGPDLEAARADIRNRILSDEAQRLMQEAMGEFDRQRRRRIGFEEAASATGLRFARAEAASAQGLDREGRPLPALSGAREVLQAAFEARQGRASDWFRLSGDVEASVLVEDIIAPRTPDLDEVRTEAIEAWRAAELDRRLRDIARRIADATAEGGSFEAAARAERLEPRVAPQPLNRQEAVQFLGQALAPQVFAAQPGQVVFEYRLMRTPQGVIPLSDALVLVEVREIQRADPSQSGPQMAALQGAESQRLASSLGDAGAAAIRGRVDIAINDEVMRALFPPTETDGAQ